MSAIQPISPNEFDSPVAAPSRLIIFGDDDRARLHFDCRLYAGANGAMRIDSAQRQANALPKSFQFLAGRCQRRCENRAAPLADTRSCRDADRLATARFAHWTEKTASRVLTRR